MRYIGILTMALSAALALLGCEKPSSTPDPDSKISNAKKKIGDAVDATTEAAKAKRDEYVLAMSKQLDELNVKVDELKGRVAKANDQAKEGLAKKLKEAEVKRALAAKKLDELKAAGADRWEKVKEGVGSALDDLKKMFQ
jgi:TolA-binding protein